MNPYTSRAMIKDPAAFFGRAAELHDLYTLLAASQSCSVVGPRHIGKSSLLCHLVRPAVYSAHLPGPEAFVFAFMDLQELAGLGPDDFFFTAAERLARAGAGRLEADPDRDGTQSGFRRFLARATDLGLRLVLCCDEFERLSGSKDGTRGESRQFTADFFTYLRGLCSNYNLALVTSSRASLFELCHVGNLQTSQFWNIFVERTLGLMPEAEARQLIREPAQRAGVTFTPEAEDFLYDLAGGHPLALQVACFHAFEAGGSTLEVEQRAAQDLAPHFQYYWDGLTAAERLALRDPAAAMRLAAGDTAARDLLRGLAQKSLLVVEGQTCRYPSRAWAGFVASQAPTQPGLPLQAGRVQAGDRLGAYEVLGLLGRGGMAEVYKGLHTRLGRTVAIKVLPADLAADPDFRLRFEREAQAVAALRHPNIMQVYDFGDVDGVYYMVIELIEGEDLARRLRQHGPLDLPQARAILNDLAGALDYAHAQGLVHRDIKPSNVMLEAGRAVLADFGIAKMLASATAATRTGLIGTLEYMAPEQIEAPAALDRRADIYALGVMLYEMLTGQLPFQRDTPGALLLAHLQDAPPDPRDLAPSLPAAAADAILRALAKDPAERFDSAGALAAALR